MTKCLARTGGGLPRKAHVSTRGVGVFHAYASADNKLSRLLLFRKKSTSLLFFLAYKIANLK